MLINLQQIYKFNLLRLADNN